MVLKQFNCLEIFDLINGIARMQWSSKKYIDLFMVLKETYGFERSQLINGQKEPNGLEKSSLHKYVDIFQDHRVV